MSDNSRKPAAKGLFDLPDSEGVNSSERFLMQLCRKSFLRLWTYPNLHTNEGFENASGSAKEFTDVLLVFGNDVVLLSDKHVHFNAEKDITVSWPRWYQRAVTRSTRQLYGALNWLQRFPDRIFLDAKCTRPLSIQ